MMLEPSLLATDRPVRLGRIAYVNVDPIYYGLEHAGKPEWLQIVSAPPAELNRKLAAAELDISSVSAFAYTGHHREWLLLPDFCIACAGNVMSVLLVSRHPLAQLTGKRIYVTDESATAAALIRLVLKMRRVAPLYETGKILSPRDVRADDDAVLVIGDTALRENWHDAFPYVWDLGDLWSELTGLPFVFAVWAVRKAFAEKHPETVATVLNLLTESRQTGMRHLEEAAINASARLRVEKKICDKYFANFCFGLKTPQMKGLTTFFQHLYTEEFLKAPVALSFFKP
ncbi:MAG: menaquinone biosynthesis protein [Desulfobacterales bacterium]|jgi:chorismate dehydratase|nr:menaquinone biosynthesis protein [Desulfobacterales bacterium]